MWRRLKIHSTETGDPRLWMFATRVLSASSYTYWRKANEVGGQIDIVTGRKSGKQKVTLGEKIDKWNSHCTIYYLKKIYYTILKSINNVSLFLEILLHLPGKLAEETYLIKQKDIV